MTQDQVIELTRSLGICELTSKPKQNIHYSLTIHEMETFAKLVAKHERNEIIEILDASTGYVHMDVIRERGQA